MRELTRLQRQRLLTTETSRQNKIWLAITLVADGFMLNWRWQGEPRRSRLQFQFCSMGFWHTAGSFDEDILPTYKMDTK